MDGPAGDAHRPVRPERQTLSTTPTVGVLALQGDVREHLAALGAAGVRAVTVRRPQELAAVDGLVIPGGESTTMSKLAVAFDLLEPLREPGSRAGLPAYGSCAGMIMLADRILDGRDDQETVGGIDMTVRRNAFGRQVDSFEAEVDVAGIDGGPVARRVHPGALGRVGGRRGRGAGHAWPAGTDRRGPAGQPAGDVVPPGADRRPAGAPVLRGTGEKRDGVIL